MSNVEKELKKKAVNKEEENKQQNKNAGKMFAVVMFASVIFGAFIGFTALIPVAGAYIGGVVGFVMILTVSPFKALLFIVFLLVLQQLEGNLIYPKVVGGSLGLPAIWVLAAVTIGGALMGISGMLIGVPIAAAVYRLVRDDVRRREQEQQMLKEQSMKEEDYKEYAKDVAERG